MMIVTFSDLEEQVVEKIKAVLAEDHEIECISIVNGKEMTFGDVEIRTKQRKVFFKGKEVELTPVRLPQGLYCPGSWACFFIWESSGSLLQWLPTG